MIAQARALLLPGRAPKAIDVNRFTDYLRACIAPFVLVLNFCRYEGQAQLTAPTSRLDEARFDGDSGQ